MSRMTKRIILSVLASVMIFTSLPSLCPATQAEASGALKGRNARVEASKYKVVPKDDGGSDKPTPKPRPRVKRPSLSVYKLWMSNRSSNYTVRVWNPGRSIRWKVTSGSRRIRVISGRRGSSFTIRPKSNGSGTITCTTGGRTLRCRFTVKLPNKNNAYLSDTYLYIDDDKNYEIYVKKTGNHSVKWEVTEGQSCINVLSDDTGSVFNIQPVKNGSGTITCQVGSKTLTCSFDVYRSPYVDQTDVTFTSMSDSANVTLSNYWSAQYDDIKWVIGSGSEYISAEASGCYCYIRPEKNGSGWIDCYIGDDLCATVFVTVNVPNNAKLDTTSLTMSSADRNYKISLTDYNSWDLDKITWTVESGSRYVKLVDTNGTSITVKPVSNGSGVIKCVIGDKTLRCDFKVDIEYPAFDSLLAYINRNGTADSGERGHTAVKIKNQYWTFTQAKTGAKRKYRINVTLVNYGSRIVIDWTMYDNNSDSDKGYHEYRFNINKYGKSTFIQAWGGNTGSENYSIESDGDFDPATFTSSTSLSYNDTTYQRFANGYSLTYAKNEAQIYYQDSFGLLNSILVTETGYSLKDLGFLSLSVPSINK